MRIGRIGTAVSHFGRFFCSTTHRPVLTTRQSVSRIQIVAVVSTMTERHQWRLMRSESGRHIDKSPARHADRVDNALLIGRLVHVDRRQLTHPCPAIWCACAFSTGHESTSRQVTNDMTSRFVRHGNGASISSTVRQAFTVHNDA